MEQAEILLGHRRPGRGPGSRPRFWPRAACSRVGTSCSSHVPWQHARRLEQCIGGGRDGPGSKAPPVVPPRLCRRSPCHPTSKLGPGSAQAPPGTWSFNNRNAAPHDRAMPRGTCRWDRRRRPHRDSISTRAVCRAWSRLGRRFSAAWTAHRRSRPTPLEKGLESCWPSFPAPQTLPINVELPLVAGRRGRSRPRRQLPPPGTRTLTCQSVRNRAGIRRPSRCQGLRAVHPGVPARGVL